MTWHRSTLLRKEDRNYIANSDIFNDLKTEHLRATYAHYTHVHGTKVKTNIILSMFERTEPKPYTLMILK